jgi:alkylation response protein AidB-like acyl-CoA dehydrogenase
MTHEPDFLWRPRLDTDSERWAALAARLTRDSFAPLAAEIDRDQRYPRENVSILIDAGLTGLLIPREFGGEGGSLTAASAVAEAVAAGCASTCTVWMSYAVGVTPLLIAGTQEQKKRILPFVAAGDGISFALTERHTGSDPSKVRTAAHPERGGWRIQGEKWMVGNGGESRFYTIFATTPGSDRLTAFVADARDGGLVVDDRMDKMGLRGATTTNLKIDTWVPAEARLGDTDRGLSIALASLSTGRIMAAAQACGIAGAAFEAASRYALERAAFGAPIIEFQGISFRLVDVGTELSAARMMTYEAALAHDRGTPSRERSSMAKLYASEMAHRAVDAAVQVFGAAGYAKPHAVERMYRDQRVIEIYEGSSEIQRVSLTRGLKRSYSAAPPAVPSAAPPAVPSAAPPAVPSAAPPSVPSAAPPSASSAAPPSARDENAGKK